MLGALKSFWLWLIDGLTDALAAVLERLRPTPLFLMTMEERGARIRTAAGEDIGRLSTEGAAQFVPDAVALALAGAAIDVEIPAAWALRRELSPIALENAPYAEAFARHQIERITPWRSADVYVRVATAPLDGDSTRLSVVLDVVARRMVEPTLSALTALAPSRLRLLTRRSGSEAPVVIPTGAMIEPGRRGRRRVVEGALVALALALVAAFGVAALRIGDLRTEIETLDARIEKLKAARLAEAGKSEGGDREDNLHLRKQARPPATATLEALSAALPDHAFVTDFALEGDRLKISGVSSSAADLAPALEQSGHFTEVAFAAATTREENGAGDKLHLDKFHLEMRVPDAAKGAAP